MKKFEETELPNNAAVQFKNGLSRSDELHCGKPIIVEKNEKAEESFDLEKNRSFVSGADISEHYTSDFDSYNSDPENELEDDEDNEVGKNASGAVALSIGDDHVNNIKLERQELKKEQEPSSPEQKIVKPVQFDFDSEMSEPMSDLEVEEEESVEELSEMQPTRGRIKIDGAESGSRNTRSVSVFAKTSVSLSQSNSEQNSIADKDLKGSKLGKLSLEDESSKSKLKLSDVGSDGKRNSQEEDFDNDTDEYDEDSFEACDSGNDDPC